MMWRALLAAIALLAAGQAAAGAWQGVGSAGKLEFTAVQAGARFTGRFKDFKVQFTFDSAAPAQGKLDVQVVLTSADTQDAERDEVLKSQDFFWTSKHALAQFHAEGFERDGKGWKAPGKLTLRGVTRPVIVRFELTPKGKRLAMKGSATVKRLEFGVGQGDWSSTEWIGDDVLVAFDLNLRPASAAASP